ncbi:MAG TPA: metalloregulator ArsR/SmtB family transcription factor [Pyrinomonadaceae bacterium]|jgi:ArsR family transcriptional regulator
MKAESVLNEMENLFLALADKTRLRLLNLMREDEVCVCFFTEVLGESQPKVSRHLSYLRNAGIVSARRDGKWIHYRIEESKSFFAAQVLRDTLQWLAAQTEMQNDYEKLAIACCAPNAPVTIMRAPKPNVFAEANMNEKQSNEKIEKRELETFLL